MLQPRPVELGLKRFSLPPLPLVSDGAAVAMDALIDNFFYGVLQPAPGDATSGGEGCYNRQVFLLEPTKGSVADFFLGWNQCLVLLLPAASFATTGDNVFLRHNS